MPPIHAIASKFDLHKLTALPALTIVDFYANWCGPCKMIAPQVEALSQRMPHVNFAKVDVDNCPDLAQEYSVQSIPTFIYFKDNRVVETLRGANVQQLEQLAEKHAVRPLTPIPPHQELEKMSVKDLKSIMEKRHISSVGMLEKGELIAVINAHR